MGISICPKQRQNTMHEVKVFIQPPPCMIKLQKVSKIILEDDVIDKEDSPMLPQIQKTDIDEMKISFTAQQSEEIDNNLEQPWLKKTFAQSQLNDIQNVSFEPNNSSFDLFKPKSILKINKNVNHSQDHISNDQLSIGSIKSNKKVSFDKQIQFSHFRKQ
ncbi:unnamed protein product [Paramecium sonneborni]|uniref:Uncharacterized protein n=1 Tax=Paramecium sonneborni TaxID=65129 RepID=A0A8S1QS46_9CILI|nr:unnamed protein product [Paramecium sonneborni]